MKLIVNRNFTIDDYVIHINLFKLHNSFLLLISDQEDLGIGNVTLGTPSIVEGIKSPTASYNLFGMNSKLISTIIAEKASSVLNSPVLLLLFLKNRKDEGTIIKPIVNFINEILKEITEEK
ncbi:MAG: hypothetical protein KGD58_12935 [Candidatus Lokiarchaeota archaeon]|nr:hypothetical protein [Candidatus Lokiarchaeota archaeon]